MESTLSLKFTDLTGEVGLFLGYGRGADNGDSAWSSQQTATIEAIVRSGLRQFYFPPPLDDGGSSYDWSFLKPYASLTLASGASTVPLPEDFGGFEGQVSVTSSGSTRPWPVKLYNEGQIVEAYAKTPTASGPPQMAALRPLRGTQDKRGQRYNLYVYPLADQAYTLLFAYYILADALSGTRPYAYGGMAHVETILESCLAIAEQRLDDASTVHSAKFMERLAASISLDRRNKAQTLGYNRDHSDMVDMWDRRGRMGWNGITVNGVQF